MKFAGIVYLIKDIVLEIHQLQLGEHGGAAGIRDHGGLESAIAQPQASVGDEDLHSTVFDKASALTFLALNGYEFPADQPEFYDAMIAIAKRELDKEGLSNTFREVWITANIPK